MNWPTLGESSDSSGGQTLFRDGQRVLECLQKSLRIATSCIDEITTVEIYVDALDQYIYYFEQQVEPVSRPSLCSP
jgi:vacuolar protein sorting-associated protein 35